MAASVAGKPRASTHEKQLPCRHQPCVHGVGAVPVLFQRERCRHQHAGQSGELAQRQGHFAFGHHAAGARELLAGAERAARAPQQVARHREFAQLRHRDAAQRQRRRVVAQGHALEGAERVAGGERAGGGGDQGVHGRRVTRRPGTP
jgi:hypothetical protein